jgi:hypothetical protein
VWEFHSGLILLEKLFKVHPSRINEVRIATRVSWSATSQLLGYSSGGHLVEISRFAKLREKDRIAGAKTNRFRVKIRHPAISADWQFLVCPGQPLNISYPQWPEGHPQTGRVFR